MVVSGWGGANTLRNTDLAPAPRAPLDLGPFNLGKKEPALLIEV